MHLTHPLDLSTTDGIALISQRGSISNGGVRRSILKMFEVAVHETLHTAGIEHAGGALQDPYGNVFDFQGNFYLYGADLGIGFKHHLGWLPSTSQATIPAWRLYPMPTPPPPCRSTS